MTGHEFNNKWIQLNPGDTLFLYTDGVTEAEDARLEEFGEDRLDRALSEMATRTVQEVAEGVVCAVQEFVAGTPQSDDITCLAVRLRTTLDAISDK